MAQFLKKKTNQEGSHGMLSIEIDKLDVIQVTKFFQMVFLDSTSLVGVSPYSDAKTHQISLDKDAPRNELS